MTHFTRNRSVFSRLRERVSSHLVMEATPEMEALDQRLRSEEQRLAPGLALLAIVLAGLSCWGGVIFLIRWAV